MNPADRERGVRFIDAHVHVKDALGLVAVVEAGVLAVWDAGTKKFVRPVIGKTVERSAAPVVVSAGWALSKKGGYGSFFGYPVETKDEIQSEILKLKRDGAGIIKVIASGIVSLAEPGRVTAGGFSGEELRFIVEQAASRGLGVMAHANGEPAIISAARAGVRSVEHGFFMSNESLDAMAKACTVWTPTVGALARVARSRVISQDMTAYINRLIDAHLVLIGRAHSIGLALAVGTDCVLPDAGYRSAYEAELRYFEKAGLSRDAVLQIACGNGVGMTGLV